MHTRIHRGNLIITIPLHRVETRRHRVSISEPQLTERQKQVFHLMREGRVAKEVAQILNLSPRTAKMHICDVYKKCGVKDRAQFGSYLNKTQRHI